jgi:hypothetical protein
MPSSKLSTFVIDCRTDDFEGAARFWSAALRRELEPAVPEYDRYRSLVCSPSEPLVMLQQVEHDSRVHLDIESDDIEAEVARLEGLGARTLERVRSWVVMEAPTGQRLCVVRPQRPTHAITPFENPTPGHALLAGFVGHYRGTTHTFLGPGDPVVDEDTLHVESVLAGRFVRLQWFGSVGGAPRQGELLLGCHREAKAWELAWMDTFHTGTYLMPFRGEVDDEARVRVVGSYAAGGETWQFGVELRREAGVLQLRATNITPGGEVYRAIETDFVPVASSR